MQRALRYGIAVGMIGAGSILWSCGGSGGAVTDPEDDPGPSDPVTEIRVAVTVDGVGASGIQVRLFAPGGTDPLSSATTAGGGVAVFQDLSAGSYEVEVVVPSGLELAVGEARRSVSVTAGSTSNVSFQLATPAAEGVVEVRLTASDTFDPSAVTIQTGETVRWVNDVSVAHTVTPQGHSQWSEATLTLAGATFQHTFTAPGTFAYLCIFHQGMTGTVTVQ
jgi:plastocyanin